MNPEMIDLSDLIVEPGRQSEVVDLSKGPSPVLHQLKTLQMTIPSGSKELIISFDDKGNISNIVFVQS